MNLEKYTKEFFVNNNRRYAKQLNQEAWKKGAFEIYQNNQQRIKKVQDNLDKIDNLFRLDDEEVFRTIYQETAEDRHLLAYSLGQESRIEVGASRLDMIINHYYMIRDNDIMDDASLHLDEIRDAALRNYNKIENSEDIIKECHNYDKRTFNYTYNFHDTDFQIFSVHLEGDNPNDITSRVELGYANLYQMDAPEEILGASIRKVIETDVSDLDSLNKNMAEFRWTATIMNFHRKGTSSITDNLEAALYDSKDIQVFQRKQGVISEAIKTLTYPSAEIYAEDYLDSFKTPPTARKEIDRAFLTQLDKGNRREL